MIDFARVRRMMVDNQLRTYDITDLGVLTAMNEVPREHFVPEDVRMLAYTDQALAVAETASGEGRHLLPPMIFGRMLQHLDLRAGMKVLVVAGALGYEALVVAKLGAEVLALESDPELAERTRANLASLGGGAVTVVLGDLREGHAEGAPYDAILVNGAVELRPDGLLGQLVEDGRLAAIVGDGSRTSRATLFVRGAEAVGARTLFDAAAPVLWQFRREPGFVF